MPGLVVRARDAVGMFQTAGITRPSPLNTGALWDIGDLTPATGSINLNQPGQIYENRYLQGQLRCSTSGLGLITIRNCIIDFRAGAQNQAIYLLSAGNTQFLIEDCEIYCPMDATNRMTIAIYGSNWTARRCYVHHSWADAFRPENNCVLESCYVENIGDVASRQHADAVQMLRGGNFTARWNYFNIPNLSEPEDKPPGSFMNSAGFMIQAEFSDLDNILIEENWINGGDFGIQMTENNDPAYFITNARVRNNRFGPEYLYGTLNTNVFTNASQVCGNRLWNPVTNVDGSLIAGNAACPV